jgi:hypothetical protein
MLSGCVALFEFASVTFTVKLDVPGVVGVPEMSPEDAFRVKPSGKLPSVIVHAYGRVPPVACRV